MTQYILKERHLQTNPHSHFFDYDTLKFFGETMSGMRVYKDTVTMTDSMGNQHTCYVLSSLQKKHPNGPQRVLHYFDVYTYEQVL